MHEEVEDEVLGSKTIATVTAKVLLAPLRK